MLLNRIFLFGRVNGGKKYGFHLGVTDQQGSLILQGNFKGHIIKHLADSNGRWVILVVVVDNSQFITVKRQQAIIYNNRKYN